MEVIPAINEKNFEEVLRKIEITQEMGAPLVQIDIGDGQYTTNKTWMNPDWLVKLPHDMPVEIHFMVRDTEEEFEEWLQPPVKRFIFHLEAAEEPHMIKNRCQKLGIEVGMAITVDDGEKVIDDWKNEFDFWQILAVTPGVSGQEFNEKALKLISYLRKKREDAKIEVDGGVNLATAKLIKKAGADIIASGSFIFKNEDPFLAYKQLKEV